MKIFGAGLAGLLAGCHFQQATIYEAQPFNKPHKAVLRFRSSAVGDAVGIEFRKVRVHKDVWPASTVNPKQANLYAQKVAGVLTNRSIWNLDAVDRYIAPEDFIEQLIERCSERIKWGCKIIGNDITRNSHRDEPIISTLPMSSLWQWFNSGAPNDLPACPVDFSFKKIFIRRFRVEGADVFQTIYFPEPDTNLYRVSITGDLLIAEYVNQIDEYVFYSAFGLRESDCQELDMGYKQYGKIKTINDEWRKEFIYDLTTRYNVFSLGRYATWRNILLDDVIKDIAVLKKMMKSSAYDRARINTK